MKRWAGPSSKSTASPSTRTAWMVKSVQSKMMRSASAAVSMSYVAVAVMTRVSKSMAAFQLVGHNRFFGSAVAVVVGGSFHVKNGLGFGRIGRGFAAAAGRTAAKAKTPPTRKDRRMVFMGITSFGI